MMESIVTGVMDDELVEELSKIAQPFKGKLVRGTIVEVNEQERKPRARREYHGPERKNFCSLSQKMAGNRY